MVLKKIFVVLCFILFLPSYLFAQEIQSFDLGEIVISKDITFGNSTYEVSSQDLDLKSADSVDEAMDFIPGVRLTLGQKNEPYVMIRGFNQDKILILLDGIPIASPYYGYVDLNQIPTESISKIKVIKGMVSPLYGANTLGGVINIVTKKPGEKPYLEFENGVSEHNTYQHILNYAVKSKGVSLWFSKSYRRSDGFRLSSDFQAQRNENGGYRDNSYYKNNGLSLKLGLEKLENHNLSVLFNYIDNEKGIPPHTTSSNPKYWKFTEWKRLIIALADEYKITDNFSLKGRVYYDKYDNTLKSFDDATYTIQTLGSSWTSIYDERSLGSSVYLNYKPDNIHALKSAFNFKQDVHKEQDDSGQPWEDYEVRTFSFGLEDLIRLNEKFSFLIGANFDIFDQIRTATENKGDEIDSFNPMFIINYTLSPETQIYTSVSKRTHFPTMNQLYSQTSGNPDLNEQQNLNYELGLRHEFKKAKFELSYFYNDVEDLIDRASKYDPFLNIQEAVFEGIESSIQAEIEKYISGRLSYTYLYARDKNPALFGRTQGNISYVPEHKADFEFKFTLDFGFSYSLLGSYNGRRYYYGSSNAQHDLGGYFVWNSRFSQKIFENWQASVNIENIFDRNYQEEEGFPQPGRRVLFSLKGKF